MGDGRALESGKGSVVGYVAECCGVAYGSLALCLGCGLWEVVLEQMRGLGGVRMAEEQA